MIKLTFGENFKYLQFFVFELYEKRKLILSKIYHFWPLTRPLTRFIPSRKDIEVENLSIISTTFRLHTHTHTSLYNYNL